AEDGIRDYKVTGVQTCALPIFFSDATTHNAFKVGDGSGVGTSTSVTWVTGATAGSTGATLYSQRYIGTDSLNALVHIIQTNYARSEERRVGKECKYRGSRDPGE